MQQQFKTRNYSVRDFREWNAKGELVLTPEFQRRAVWGEKAKSFLIDTIVRGKPIPKIYMRQDIHPKTHRAKREMVDGQQRLRTVLSFLEDAFRLSKTHNEDFGGNYFSGLPEEVQVDILKYEFVVDLLEDMPDTDVYDVFARINTYSERLKPQELRNARWFGEFKTSAYSLAREFLTFFRVNSFFTATALLRMQEVEFVSDLLLATQVGVRAGDKNVIDKAYRDYDDELPDRKLKEKQFRSTMDTIGNIFGDELVSSCFKATRLFYPLFCAVYHLNFGLPNFKYPHAPIKPTQYARVREALDAIDAQLEEIRQAHVDGYELRLSSEVRKFVDAYNVHWVHSDKRTTLTKYILKGIKQALG